ncbi:hypothetical protein [Streptomyces sp. NPDC053720]|uniref:hypothetical protein n=1 Tax=Streptomyces sp. NPDC053720 TaxID=3154855 RepID=UPI0034355B75
MGKNQGVTIQAGNIEGGITINGDSVTIGGETVSSDSTTVHAPVFSGNNVTIINGDNEGGIHQSF